jgi:undecaprenyl-diphosphatase
MIEKLESIDRWIVLTVNSWDTPFLDELMWVISQRATWIPLYLILFILAYKRLNKKQLIVFALCAILAVAIADLVSVHLFKNVFLRYRPSHNALLTEQLHFYMKSNGELYKGGMYGFVSSHAANFFAMATFISLALRKYYPLMVWTLLSIATIVSFSRLYQGVHYLSDLVVGGSVGALVAYLVYRLLYRRIKLN